MNRQELNEAKVKLYRALLEMPISEITDDEAQLGFVLACDKDIQAILHKKLGDGK